MCRLRVNLTFGMLNTFRDPLISGENASNGKRLLVKTALVPISLAETSYCNHKPSKAVLKFSPYNQLFV